MNLPDWLLLISALLAGAVFVSVVAERVRLPLTVVLAVVGFLVNWLVRPFGIISPLRGELFEEVVVFVFLPILVFEAALGISTRAFVRNLGAILVLAVPALVTSAALVGIAVHMALGIPLVAALVFGSLISATDPVAVVAIFRKLGVPERLLAIVEGESLLNDGVAIVLFNVLLAAALGGAISIGGGIVDFLLVFFGGIGIGAIVGIAAAFVSSWLDRLSAAALSITVAYGGFVLADDVLGFSGVMATVTAGLVLGGLAPSRASAETREMWHQLWASLGYTANALLFLFIGFAINPYLISGNLRAVGLATLAVLVARAMAVVPLVALMERVADIPRFGMRNQAVLVWGGLRGGIALALALALPEDLPARDLFIAMTGGVVLATLLLNATTIGFLVRALGLDVPSRADQFLGISARLTGCLAVRSRLAELHLSDPVIAKHIDYAERTALRELARIDLNEMEKVQVVASRGLAVERETYQRLHDLGLLPPPVTRALLHEVDDQIEDVSLGRADLKAMRRRSRPRFDWLVEQLTGWLPEPLGEDALALAFSEASARQLAARRTSEALDLFENLPNIEPETVERARVIFTRWEAEAIAELQELDRRVGQNGALLRHKQAVALSRVAVTDALDHLAEIGLLSEIVAQRANETVAREVEEPQDA